MQPLPPRLGQRLRHQHAAGPNDARPGSMLHLPVTASRSPRPAAQSGAPPERSEGAGPEDSPIPCPSSPAKFHDDAAARPALTPEEPAGAVRALAQALADTPRPARRAAAASAADRPSRRWGQIRQIGPFPDPNFVMLASTRVDATPACSKLMPTR